LADAAWLREEPAVFGIVASVLLQHAKAGYIGREENEEAMRIFVVVAAAIAVFTACAAPAGAATKRQHPVVQRSAAGTVIQPTTTILHDGNGHTTVIVVPRRSYLDTGTEVSVGDRSYMDYMLPPGGDPGRGNWFYGPDVQGTGRYPLPSAFDGTGFNPNTPF
jgi:hypothetical protein